MLKANNFGIPGAFHRGGTGKAVFLHEYALPAPSLQSYRLLKRIMRSPDPLQVDEMGGSEMRG